MTNPLETTVSEALQKIIVTLADEGVPVRSIARVTKVPSVEVREILEYAMQSGAILQIPRDDWPVNSTRQSRHPELGRIATLDDDIIRLNVVRFFRVTQQQASLLITLLKRREVTRQMLHTVIESRRPEPKTETDQKIVDVVICKLRKRLKEFGLTISTVWSCGYLMPPADREKALKMLNDFMGSQDGIKVEDPVK